MTPPAARAAVTAIAVPAVVLAAVLLCAVDPALAGDEIVLTNGRVLEGEIVEETDDAIVLQREHGRITIPRADIRKIRRDGDPPAGAGDEDRAPGADRPPRVDVQWLSVVHRRDARGRVVVVGEFRNTTDDTLAGMKARVRLTDGDGEPLHAEDGTVLLPAVEPGATGAVQAVLDWEDDWSGAEIVLRAAGPTEGVEPVRLAAGPADSRVDAMGILRLSGSATNDTEHTVTGTVVICLLRDGEGTLVATSTTVPRPSFLRPGDEATWRLLTVAPEPDDLRPEVIVVGWKSP